MPSEIVVFNSETVRQSERVIMFAPELPRNTVTEYRQKRAIMLKRQNMKFLRISFIMYLSTILVIGLWKIMKL